jgi:hypothetical protein
VLLRYGLLVDNHHPNCKEGRMFHRKPAHLNKTYTTKPREKEKVEEAEVAFKKTKATT